MPRRFVALALIVALIIAACAPAATPTPAPPKPPESKPAAPAPTAAPAKPTEAKPAVPAPTQAPAAAPAAKPAAKPATGEPIKIGIPASLTGPSSNFGKNDQIAFEIARKEVNDAGGANGRPFEFNYIDMQAKPELAASVTERLINVDKAPLILGVDTSSTCMAAAKVAQQNKVPYLMHVCLGDDITRQGWEYVFRLQPPASANFFGLLDFIGKVVKAQSMFLIYENSLYGTTGNNTMKQWAEQNKVKYNSEPFEPGGVDFKPVLTKVKAADPDVAVYAAYLADAMTFTRQTAELGIKPRLLAGTGAGYLYSEWLQGVGNLAENYAVASISARDVKYPGAAEFWEKFAQASGGKEATFSQSGAYSSVYVLKDLFERVKLTGDIAKDRDALREGLAKTNLMTPSGPIKFENYGGFTNQVNLPTIVLQVQKNSKTNKLDWFTVWPPEAASTKPVYPVPGLKQ